MKKKIILVMFLMLVFGCTNQDKGKNIDGKEKGQDIEIVKKIISDSDYKLYHNRGTENNNSAIGYLLRISDNPFIEVHFTADVLDNKVNTIKFNCISAENNDISEHIIYSVDGKEINEKAEKEAIEVLSKNNLKIIDIYNYSQYCITNEYYKDFVN